MENSKLQSSLIKTTRSLNSFAQKLDSQIVSGNLSESVQREDVIQQGDISATQCGFWKASVTKTQDVQKDDQSYEKLYKYLDKDLKEKFDSLSSQDRKIISMIYNNISKKYNFRVSDICFTDSNDAFYSNDKNFNSDVNAEKQKKAIINNLIEIFNNNEYSSLKDYFVKNANNPSLKTDMIECYEVSDINNYLDKTKLLPEQFFQNDKNFEIIMSIIQNTHFENEEIKNNVKKSLFELSNNQAVKNTGLSDKDIGSIIKFLTDKNGIIKNKSRNLIVNDSIDLRMKILNKLNLFDYQSTFSTKDYNIEDKIELFNTFVDLIPENEFFEDYEDKIVECFNQAILGVNGPKSYLEGILMPNINTIKERGFKTLLDRMCKCPYRQNLTKEFYCSLIFNKDDKYANTSASILNLVLSQMRRTRKFDDLYDKYIPMLQGADEDTLNKIKPINLNQLYKLYDFLNSISEDSDEISLNSLSFEKLKELQLILIKNNYTKTFENIDISFIHEKLDKLFLKNDNKIDFDATIFEINKLLVTKHFDLSQIQKDNIDNILEVKDNLANIDFENITIARTNNFEILKQDIQMILSNDMSLSDKDKKIIMSRLNDDITSMMFNKLPDELDSFDVVNNIRTKISEYLSFKQIEGENNAYSIGNVIIQNISEEQKETLEHIFKAIPELVVLLGKKQKGHNFDIGKHILAVGKEVVKNEKFPLLQENNQKLVLIAALMHDIAKVEGGDDSTHPQRGSQYAYNMLNGVISDDDRETVANLIFNHHFGEYMEHNNDSNNNEKMFTLAYECNDKNLQFIDMLEILGEADLKGDDEDYNISRSEYCEQIPERIQALRTQIQCIDDILKKLEDSLELTPFPQKTVDMTTELQNNEKTMSIKQECKDLRIIGEFESEGVKIPKIDLSKMKDVSCDKQKEYLEFLGFGENSNYNNLEFLIHAINGASQIDGIDYVTNQFKPDSTLSTSIITMANTTTFKNRKYGFIMDPRSTKVLYADTANISSGYAKSRNESGKYIFSSQNIDYAELSNYIHASRDKVKDEHSELITIDNKIAAIFVKEGAENDVPLRLVQFAHQYNLPLVIVPNTKFQEA